MPVSTNLPVDRIISPKLEDRAKALIELFTKWGLPKGKAFPDSKGKFFFMAAERSPELTYQLNMLSMAVGRSGSFDIVCQLFDGLRWVAYGCPVIKISSALMDRLLLTDPADVDPSDIRLPFPSFCISFPPGYLTVDPIKDWNYPGENTGVRLITVHTYKATPLNSLDDTISPDDVQSMIDAGHIENQDFLSIRMFADRVCVYEGARPPSAGRDLNGNSQTLEEWLVRGPGVEARHSMDGPTQTDKKAIAATRRLLVNLCLYISEKGLHGRKQVHNKAKLRRMLKDPLEQTTQNVWFLGQEIKFDLDLHASAVDWVAFSNGDEAKWKLRKQYVVMGHFRNQACGPARSLRKRIWIEPFWKGKTGLVMSHIYSMEK